MAGGVSIYLGKIKEGKSFQRDAARPTLLEKRQRGRRFFFVVVMTCAIRPGLIIYLFIYLFNITGGINTTSGWF